MVKQTSTPPTKKARSTTSKSPKTTKTKVVKKEIEKTTEQPISTPEVSQDQPINALTFLKAWADGWKKSFTLKGRSSRFELWSFLLLNSILMIIIQLKCSYILSSRFLLSANQKGYTLTQIEQHITLATIVFYLTIFIPLIPLVSLIIRRMHDLGKLAWNNYFEPLFMSIVAMSLLLVAISELENTDYANLMLCLSVFFITMLSAAGFYGIKILIMTLFYRGDTKANDYGLPSYNDDTHEELALNLSCYYFLFIIAIGLLYLTIALV